MHEQSIRLAKQSYSEQVVRKALYWLSQHAQWTLTDCSDTWYVSLASDSPVTAETELYRLLNDQVLREKLDNETGDLRRRIIRKVLVDIDKSL